jgi:type II secretory pathway pseudopilin PulG
VRTLRRDSHTGQAGITLIELLVSMIVLGIVTTMLIVGWVALQRASAYSVSTSYSHATLRDAMSRISNELRGAQPTSLPTAVPSPALQPPVTMAAPMEVRFNSSFNSSGANADGSGLTALRPTRVWLDTATVPSPPWNAEGRTLYWQRDMNGNGSFTDAGDRSIVLARNVVNTTIADATNGTSYTPVFRYAYRATAGASAQWTDNAGSSLDLAAIIAVRVRLIIDPNSTDSPNPADITTTIRLRNASSN